MYFEPDTKYHKLEQGVYLLSEIYSVYNNILKTVGKGEHHHQVHYDTLHSLRDVVQKVANEIEEIVWEDEDEV